MPGAPTSLIPVPVTGIQSRRVCAVGGLLARKVFIAQRLGRLDSCDGHRNEGGRGGSFRFYDLSELTHTLSLSSLASLHRPCSQHLMGINRWDFRLETMPASYFHPRAFIPIYNHPVPPSDTVTRQFRWHIREYLRITDNIREEPVR